MKGKMVEKVPKTDAGKRWMNIPANILPNVEYHLNHYVDSDPDSPLLVGVKGGALSPSVLYTAWYKALKAVGVQYRLHDLRHTGLNWSGSTGATTKELMRRGGHSSPAAALRYQHATDDRDEVLAAALAKVAPVIPLRGRQDGRAMDARWGSKRGDSETGYLPGSHL